MSSNCSFLNCSKFLTSFDEIMIMEPCEKETQFRGKSEFT